MVYCASRPRDMRGSGASNKLYTEYGKTGGSITQYKNWEKDSRKDSGGLEKKWKQRQN